MIIIPLRGSILQVGTCQILSLAKNPRWSRVWQYQGDSPLVTDIICGECAETFGSEYDFNIHMPAHAVSVGIKSEKCDFSSE